MSVTSLPKWFVPDAPPLTLEETQQAVQDLATVVPYPKVVRDYVDKPVVGQQMGIISFQLFAQPRKLRNGKPVYGFCKLRSNWPTKKMAEDKCIEIIKDQDSVHRCFVVPTGHWMPITEDTEFCRDFLDVNTDKNTVVHLRDEVAKEKEAEQKRIIRELKEREEEVKKGDIYDDPTSLTYYTMKRNTEMVCKDNLLRALKTVEDWKEKTLRTRRELAALQRDHPEYADCWIDRYNEERAKTGIPPFVPSADQFDEYDEFYRDFCAEKNSVKV